MNALKSLIITTSNNKLADTTNKTSLWLEDLAAPYFTLKDGGEYITIVSPQGGQIPIDPKSESTAAATKTIRTIVIKITIIVAKRVIIIVPIMFLSTRTCNLYE